MLPAAITLTPIALLGRFVSIGLDGTASTTFAPMIAEAVMIALLVFARKIFTK
jgi:hypothetical protein